jgi:hypothetical protein
MSGLSLSLSLCIISKSGRSATQVFFFSSASPLAAAPLFSLAPQKSAPRAISANDEKSKELCVR